MKNQFSHEFSIKHISTPTDGDYIKALKIYSSITPFEIITPTNEISFWVEQQNEKTPFELHIFVLILNGDVVGFAMHTYIKSLSLIVNEYMSLDEPVRHPKIFSIYEDLIMHYYNESNVQINFCITEISNKNNGNSVNSESMISFKQLCLDDYGKVNAKYITPPLGLNNHESSFEGFLYIKDINHSNSISSTTYVNILQSLLYDYWIPWYMPFLSNSENEIFAKRIKNLLENIRRDIACNENISIIYSSCNDRYSPVRLSNELIPLRKEKRRTLKYAVPLVLAITIIPLVLFFLYSVVLSKLGFELDKNSSAIGAMVSAVIAVVVSRLIKEKD